MDGNNLVSSDIVRLRNLLGILDSQQMAVRDVELLQSQFRAVLRDLDMITAHEQENIDSISKKRRGEIVSSSEKNICKAEDALKKARVERDRNFERCKKDRIANETAELIEETKQFRSERKELLKENKMSAICRTKAFLALFAAKSVPERIFQIFVFVLLFCVAPYIIYIFIPFKATLVLAALYSVITLLLLFGYLAVSNFIREYKWDIIKKIRIHNRGIRKNRKRIIEIKTSIKKDVSDENYDLTEYDDKIKEAETIYKGAVDNKESLLNEFDNVTRKEIENEVKNKNKTERETLLTLRGDIGEKLKAAEAKQREIAGRIMTEYSPYINKEYMKKESVVELIGILESGKATSISSAVKYLNALKSMS